MDNNTLINIAVGASAGSVSWKNKKFTWPAFVKRLKTCQKTNETIKEFQSLSKADKSKIKDVGGFVGGYLRQGRRLKENVLYRQLITLDLDYATKEVWDDIEFLYGNAAILHTTHSHREDSQRFRLIMPISREVTPDEYLAISRKIAGDIGIELFDITTFDINRLMFWPSIPRDGEYIINEQEGPWLDADEILGSYTDWTDSSEWPVSVKEKEKITREVSKQEDPETKKGMIGAFCRTYTIEEAIEKFLGDIYEPTTGGRYTYMAGTSASGLVLYENKFAYSHHGTDPCSGQLCNAFDLVRIHKFRHEDTGNSIKNSMSLMMEFARNDEEIRKTVSIENYESARLDFAEELEAIEEEDFEWMKKLEMDTKGRYLSTSGNLNIIFANDPRLKNCFRLNNFDAKAYITRSVPWRKIEEWEPIKNVDISGVRNYIDTIYGITGEVKVKDAFTLEFNRNSYHPVREYLNSLAWDNVPRIDTLLPVYFGTEENIYTKEVMRKTLTGAVSRVFKPGVKFDTVMVLIGDEGKGKSTFVRKLGKQWFSDSFTTLKNKESFEQLQGAWIMEMAELAGIKKAESESVKHYITKQEDGYRPAYGHVYEYFPRQVIFIGTGNKKTFLFDTTGNRRFLPIDADFEKATKSIFKIKDSEIDQVWAEAVQLYRSGEKPYLSKEAEYFARKEQKGHSEIDERIGLIEKFLDTKLPRNWEDKDIYERRDHFTDPLSSEGTVEREYFCIAEIWCECLGKEKEDMDRYKTRDLNEILRGLEDWEPANSTKTFTLYGRQRYYKRKEQDIF